MKNSKFKEGQFVVYNPKLENERGRIKSLCSDPNFAFVVYKCADNWDNYKDYTAQRTAISDLVLYPFQISEKIKRK